MAKVGIKVNGKAYPCRPTMGAMLRFKRETGKEVTDIDPGSLSDVCTYLWCCVVSACKADGIDFGLSLLDFADAVSSEDMAGWVNAAATKDEGKEDAGKEKKTSES